MANGHIADPDFVRDPSGCTAVAALITEDDRIFVVSQTVSCGPPMTMTKSSLLSLSLLSFLLGGFGFRQQANAGDSRCVLGTKGDSKPLSFDHKPNNESPSTLSLSYLDHLPIFPRLAEMSRIFRAGGYVEYGRVNGRIQSSCWM